MNIIEQTGIFSNTNTDVGTKIIMKDDATNRQVELAKEFYSDAIVEIEQKLSQSLYENEKGNQECAVWLKGQESSAVYFEVVDGILKIK